MVASLGWGFQLSPTLAGTLPAPLHPTKKQVQMLEPLLEREFTAIHPAQGEILTIAVTPRDYCWRAWKDSNLRHQGSKPCALSKLSYRRI